jgi:hypothetical protein
MKPLPSVGSLCLLLVICLCLQGCGKPRTYASNEPIPLGSTVMTVQGAETATFRDKNLLAVSLRWTGERTVKEKLTGRLWVMRRHFRIVDGSGSTHYPSQIMDEYSWRHLQQQQQSATRHRQQLEYDKLAMTEEYVMLFEVPAGIQDVTFIVKNPWREKGQPQAAAVS